MVVRIPAVKSYIIKKKPAQKYFMDIPWFIQSYYRGKN